MNWNEILRMPSVEELEHARQLRLRFKGSILSLYRGHDIVEGESGFEVWNDSIKLAKCNSAWSCKCYIDELLSP